MEHLNVFYPSHDGVFDKNLLTMSQQLPRSHVGGEENLYGKPNMLIAVDHHHPSFDVVRNHAKVFAEWYKPVEAHVSMARKTHKTRKNRKSRALV
jgi:hypothetical protein